ncbi:MAG: hypothetical protein LJE69_18925 [Thiohalocapsa sp.]|jgi:hypothetical protein|uniref:hypothetical protein n=1 Tax=Thiohalocapsa sp. TaxID=2497641 RepID=UPI0025DB47C6|nr:hypothetical protein [Thiohalocapsa sp.]MCG6943311.1 hypothetical protein [Thiohalocapsa sp.]
MAREASTKSLAHPTAGSGAAVSAARRAAIFTPPAHGPLLAAALLTALGVQAAATAPETPAASPANELQVAAADTTEPDGSAAPIEANPPDSPALPDGAPRWLDAVREQRRALQERRRAEHQARRRAIDPVGAAHHEALEEEFFRRRQEIRDQMAQDRWWFLNFGPWMLPLPSSPGASPSPPGTMPPDAGSEPGQTPEGPAAPAPQPPEWNNGWYFHGW